MLLLTFIATERKSKSAPFFRVPNGGFIITVSTIGPGESTKMIISYEFVAETILSNR